MRLRLSEEWFSERSRSVLCGVRADSTEEFSARTCYVVDWLNAQSGIFRWTYGFDDRERSTASKCEKVSAHRNAPLV